MPSWSDGAVDELIAATGGDYTTLTAWEGAHDGETPTNGTTCKARIKGNTGDSGNLYWGGWVSGQNATTYLIITADTGCFTDGTNGTGDDAVIDNNSWIVDQTTNQLWMDFIGVEFACEWALNQSGGGQVRFARCFFRDKSGSAINCVYTGGDITLKIGGCLFTDIGTNSYHGAVKLASSSITTTVEIFNTTCIGGFGGIIETAGTCKTRNCACSGTGWYDGFYSVSDENYCAADDTSCNGANSVPDSTLTLTDADDFTAPSTDDYRIYNTSSVLYEAGESRAESWFTSLCSTDMLGTSWRATPAIGCYELVVAGGANAPTGNIYGPLTGPLGGVV